MNKILTKFLSKSFSKLAPNSTVTNTMIAHVIETAAMTQDFIENTSKELGNKPNADIIFKRLKASNIKILKIAFLFILSFIIKQVKNKFNFREWTIAIDAHSEPFYGERTSLWIHGYKPVRGCKGSYKFITVSVVIGDAKFTLLALPVKRGDYTEILVEELIREAGKNFRIKLALLDRGFYSGNIVSTLKELKINYIIFAPQNKKNKKFLEETKEFSHRFVNHELPTYKIKNPGKVEVKLLIIRDFIDFKNWTIYDWIFATNLSNLKSLSYVKLYKKRWGIETTYRLFGKFRIITTSTNNVVRYFLFLIVILLYNLWKFYNFISKKRISFKTFAFILFLAEINIDHINACRKEMEGVMKKIKFTALDL